MDGEHGPFDLPIVVIVDGGDARGQSGADLGNSEDDDGLNHGGRERRLASWSGRDP